MTRIRSGSDRWAHCGQSTVLLVVLMAVATAAYADKNKVSKDLQNATSTKAVNVIVQYSLLPGVAETLHAKGHGGIVKSVLPLVNGLKLSLPANQALALSNDPNVVYVSPDRPLLGALNNSAPARREMAPTARFIATTINSVVTNACQ